MRFILHFIFYGLLFYAIWFFFPEFFTTLVTWAGELFAWIKGVIDKFSSNVHTASQQKLQSMILLPFIKSYF